MRSSRRFAGIRLRYANRSVERVFLRLVGNLASTLQSRPPTVDDRSNRLLNSLVDTLQSRNLDVDGRSNGLLDALSNTLQSTFLILNDRSNGLLASYVDSLLSNFLALNDRSSRLLAILLGGRLTLEGNVLGPIDERSTLASSSSSSSWVSFSPSSSPSRVAVASF